MHMRTLVIFSAWMLGIAAAGAGELSGYVSVEGRAFFHDALYSGQERDNGSIAAEPEYYHEWEDGSSFTFTPFARLDSADSERTHMDVRELNYLFRENIWFFRVGVGKVFWGATEFVHLVDIVNQTDLVEHIDGEDKLGQPMLQFGISPSWGNIEVFMMPFFRERTFPGQDGRLRDRRVVDVDDPVYESTSEDRNVDLAVRYSNTIGSADFGVYLFRGTDREPLLVPPNRINPADTDTTRLIPFYQKINQFGGDLQVATGNWLWKWEAYFRNGYAQDYFATVGGLEYTFFDIAGSGNDVGILSEYAHNDRNDGGLTLFQNDLFIGGRWTPNDAAGTQLLMGFAQDLEQSENLLTVEASRRFGDNWKLILEAWLFLESEPNGVLHSLRDDDFARLELAYYF
jgi:hypothetical protein